MESKPGIPIPAYFIESQQLSTKKAKRLLNVTPRELYPKTPAVRSSVKNRFCKTLFNNKPQAISFQHNRENANLSKQYDDSICETYMNQCFEIISLLGTGSFGKVFKVLSREDGKFYAVKKAKERFKGEKDRRLKLEEVKKHEQLPKHPNCVDFVTAWEENSRLFIQTELCETSLNKIAEQNDEIPENIVWIFLIHLLQAVQHLHHHNLLHLDIKPANILVSRSGICKLGDFGLVIEQSMNDLHDPLEGDPKYMAPELLEGIFTRAADIFSLGMSILELGCDLDLPQSGDAWHQLRSGILPQEFVSNISSDLKTILSLMLCPDYSARPSAEQLLKHPNVSQAKLKFKLDSSCALEVILNTTACQENKAKSTPHQMISPMVNVIAQPSMSSMYFLRSGWNVCNSFFKDIFNWFMDSVHNHNFTFTQRTPKRSFSDLNLSYSDDDSSCFEADSVIRGNHLHYKLHSTGSSEGSLLDDSLYKSFTNIDDGLVNSTPVKRKGHESAFHNSKIRRISDEFNVSSTEISSPIFSLEPKNLLEAGLFDLTDEEC